MIIYNAHILPMEAPEIKNGFVRTDNGLITEIGEGLPIGITDGNIANGNIAHGNIDAHGCLLMPGFIDAHSHIGLIANGFTGIEADDVNEATDPITPQLRSIDGLCFTDGCFEDAVKAGVTVSVTGAGSANPIGGDLIAVKTYGRCADEMLLKRVAIKFALGENPKTTYSDRDETPVTRMATAALIREALFKAERYMDDVDAAKDDDADMPDYDIKCEALIPLLKREIQAHFHCHRADDIMTAVRIAEEFKLDYVLIHCTEGHIIADILNEKHACAIVGPIISDRGKPELAKITTSNAAVLFKNNVKTAVCTDHPEVPVQYLAASAAFCAKAGLPCEEALKAITINPAEMLHISDRVGSIKVGKDADFVLVDGNPLDIMSSVVMTVIDGKIVYSKN